MSLRKIPDSRLTLSLSSWITFAIALTFYWITADPGASYWDCPEYVVSASRLEIGHPPGNPVWMLAMRVATLPFASSHHAYVINLCSGLFMAFAALFLARIIFVLTLSFLKNRSTRFKTHRKEGLWASSFISIGASLCFALCDSAWFSAAEAEVYAMSTFIASASLWLMVIWWFSRSRARRTRILLLVVYLTGLSLGVHQLNLLLIPIFTLIIFYKKCPQRVNPGIVISVIILSILIVPGILMALIPGILFGAKSFELLAVNHWGLPYHSGVIIFICLILLFFGIAVIISQRFYFYKNSGLYGNLQAFFLGLAFLFIGFSSFGMIMIRAAASPPMNEGTPDNIFALASYISRDQYPSTPLLYGQTPFSRPMFEEKFIDGKPVYNRYALIKSKPQYLPWTEGAVLNHRSGMVSQSDSVENYKVQTERHGYLLSDYNFRQRLTPELDMWLPRITSRDYSDRKAYEGWAGMTLENMAEIPISEAIDSAGRPVTRLGPDGERTYVTSYRPTYMHNLRYFISYQAYYMYFRYLSWNFIGRQNDFSSTGEIEHGNFITGISPLDNAMLGDSSYMPAELGSENKGRNIYFGIPFILGITGIIWLFLGRRRERRVLTLITLFFLMTGLFIVAYLNQSPGEPRERDYTFLLNYQAFTLWIAAGLCGIASFFLQRLPAKFSLCVIFCISFFPPALMAVENFDDHDRRNRFEPSFYALSLLDFEHPAIIFSHGDNSTFPLWYASEILNPENPHTVIDVTYLSQPRYVTNLRKQGYKGINLIGKSSELDFGKFLITRLPEYDADKSLPLDSAVKQLYLSSERTPAWESAVVTIPLSEKDSVAINLREISGGSALLSFRSLMLLDLLASYNTNDKILFFPSLMDFSFYKGIKKALRPALFGKIYAPSLTDSVVKTLLQRDVEREISKFESGNFKPHYTDEVIRDRSVRYRGEMIIAANDLMVMGDSVSARKISEFIEEFMPYSQLLPGSFTMEDSTYYEGWEYVALMGNLYDATGDEKYRERGLRLDSLMKGRQEEWKKYYMSLSPQQRSNISNRSRRMLIQRHGSYPDIIK